MTSFLPAIYLSLTFAATICAAEIGFRLGGMAFAVVLAIMIFTAFQLLTGPELVASLFV